MSSATSPANTPARPNPTEASRPARSQATKPSQPTQAVEGPLLTPYDEEALLKLNLSDLQIPKISGLHVEGFKPSLLSRLFGRK